MRSCPPRKVSALCAVSSRNWAPETRAGSTTTTAASIRGEAARGSATQRVARPTRPGGCSSAAGLQVGVEPTYDTFHQVDLIAAFEEEMSLIRIDHELSPYSQAAQGVPIFIRLRDRHLGIAVPSYEQGGRADLVDEGKGRAALVHLGIVVD